MSLHQARIGTSTPTPHPVLRLERIGKIYPTGEVLRDVTWEVKVGDRIGLVGVNGAGKSTQMKIIAGLEEASSGLVVKQGEPRIAYLQQEFDVDPQRSVREELFQAFGEAAEVLLRKHQVEQAMASEQAATDPDHLDGLIHELGRLHSRFEALHGYELDARIDKLLPTIGFTPEGAEQLVGDFSGGWQMRIALGKILLQEPDLLLLDEPTNHLDLEMRQALAVALQDFSGAMVIVSHDRHLLRVSTDTLLLVHAGTVAEFDGGLDDYPNWLVGQHRERRSAANDSGKDSAADRKAQKRREAEKRTLLAPLRKLMQKYEHELEALQAEQNRLDARLTDNALYEQGDGDAVRELLAERARNQALLDAAENRWLEACEDLEQRQRE